MILVNPLCICSRVFTFFTSFLTCGDQNWMHNFCCGPIRTLFRFSSQFCIDFVLKILIYEARDSMFLWLLSHSSNIHACEHAVPSWPACSLELYNLLCVASPDPSAKKTLALLGIKYHLPLCKLICGVAAYWSCPHCFQCLQIWYNRQNLKLCCDLYTLIRNVITFWDF